MDGFRLFSSLARHMRFCTVPLAVVLLLACSPVWAVTIITGDGSGNTTAPADDPGWDHVGRMSNGLTGVYIGSGWVLTANHVGARTIQLVGVDYDPVPGSDIQLQTDASNDADLLMYQIIGDPGLPVLSISLATPVVTSEVIMIGRGYDRDPNQTWWDALWNEVPEGDPSLVYTGWKRDEPPSRTTRWGNNAISEIDLDILIGASLTRSFAVDFDETGQTTHEAHAVAGDSGGAVFYENGGSWELAGIMFATDVEPGQPSFSSVYGSRTYSSDLSFYRDQITAIIPEPSTLALVGLGLAGLGLQRRPLFR